MVVKVELVMVERIQISHYFGNSSNSLNTPPCESLPRPHKPVPYFIVADDTLSFTSTLMKFYRKINNKGNKERDHFSRACRIVENSLDILASVFRVLRKPMLIPPEKAAIINSGLYCSA